MTEHKNGKPNKLFIFVSEFGQNQRQSKRGCHQAKKNPERTEIHSAKRNQRRASRGDEQVSKHSSKSRSGKHPVQNESVRNFEKVSGKGSHSEAKFGTVEARSSGEEDAEEIREVSKEREGCHPKKKERASAQSVEAVAKKKKYRGQIESLQKALEKDGESESLLQN